MFRGRIEVYIDVYIYVGIMELTYHIGCKARVSE